MKLQSHGEKLETEEWPRDAIQSGRENCESDQAIADHLIGSCHIQTEIEQESANQKSLRSHITTNAVHNI